MKILIVIIILLLSFEVCNPGNEDYICDCQEPSCGCTIID